MKFDELSDGAFLDLVSQDVKGKLDLETAAALRTPENVDRWHDALVSTLRSINAQLAANHSDQIALAAEFSGMGARGRKTWLATKAELLKKRKGIVRVKNGVEDRLAEAKRVRAKYRAKSHITTVVSERNHALKEINALRQAILAHRAAVDGVDEPDGAADEALWSLVDREHAID